MKVFSLLFAVILVVAVQAIDHKEYKEVDLHAPVEYEYHYAVHDPHTGDIKSQKETRKDDKVEGSYELIDSDGYRRLVHYKADKHNGFEAVVHREPTHIKIPEYKHKEEHKIQYSHKSDNHQHDYYSKY